MDSQHTNEDVIIRNVDFGSSHHSSDESDLVHIPRHNDSTNQLDVNKMLEDKTDFMHKISKGFKTEKDIL